jgi:hypothetical protein
MDKMITWLRQEYESIFKDRRSGQMTVSRGKVHTYLGKTLDYTICGQVKITMIGYVDEILTAFNKVDPKGCGTNTSTASKNLFKINKDCEKLQPGKAMEFHNLVAKTLYATKCARPVTCTAITFLMMRVQAPNKDDWNKLVHLMKYLRGRRTMLLILSTNSSGILKWWVDASFTVHPNMLGHSGGGLSLGQGFSIVSSSKQKINSCSSTETEIVGADDLCQQSFGPHISWELKATTFKTIFCSKTTRALFFWRRVARLQAASAPSTSTFSISPLPTESKRAMCHWSCVQLET